MTRPLYSRVLSLALTLWMSLFLGESEWLVRCPAHGGGMHAASAAALPGVSHDASSATGHDHGAAAEAPAGHGERHTCSCPGPGCCPPAVAVVPAAAVPIEHVIAVHEARAASTLDRLEDDAEYLLPPATAPPAGPLAPAA